MTVRDEIPLGLQAAGPVKIPSFFLRTVLSDMHHIEIISRLEGEHVEELAELIAAATKADGHDPIGEHKFLHLRMGADLAVGFLAYEGKRLVGYAHTLTFQAGGERRVSCEIVVHPDGRRSGIGGALLTFVIRHAEAQKASRLDLWAYNDSTASRVMTRAFHLQPTRKLLHMHRHPGPPPVVETPPGVRIRPFLPGEDDKRWLALNNRIFAGHPENGSWTLDDLHARMAQPWFRAEDLLMLEVEGELAGFCWVKVQERGDEGRIGEIYIIGTAPEYHGRGLGRYLLGEALRHLSNRDVNACAVYVESTNERAVALYWSFEFHHHHVDVLYSLPLPAQSREAKAAPAVHQHD
jgi:mycothiol synthase